MVNYKRERLSSSSYEYNYYNLSYKFLGMKFWKTNKKVKAVSEAHYNAFLGVSSQDFSDDSDFELAPPFPKRTAYTPVYISSSEDEVVPSTSKGKEKCKGKEKLHSDERLRSIENRLAKLEKSPVTTLTANDEMKELLKCVICKSLLSTDLSILSCCSQLSCKQCLQQWINAAENPTCPLCRSAVNQEENYVIPRCLVNILELLGKMENQSTHGESH